jgi:hydroxymethylbilane synthase
MHIRLGTRGSTLATTQSGLVADALVAAAEARGIALEVEMVKIATEGDLTRGSLVGLSEVGVFVNALRAAVLSGDCDLVVHSLKDIPTAPHPDLSLAALPQREDVRDALCAGGLTLEGLPPAAQIGTGSPRRAAQLLALRPDAVPVPIRGNVDTRLGLIGGGLDGVILAAAGLNRLGRGGEVDHLFTHDEMLPAPGQGALAVEIAADAPPELADLVAAIDHPDTRSAVTAERAALAVLDAGCSTPVGAYATVADGVVTLQARALSLDGTLMLTERSRGSAAHADSVGRAVGHALLGRGAASLMSRS